MVNYRGTGSVLMKKKNTDRKNLEYFGSKCVLLAVAILLIAGTIVVTHVIPGLISSDMYTVLSIIALIIVAAVMLLEIRTYIRSATRVSAVFTAKRTLRLKNSVSSISLSETTLLFTIFSR